MNLFEEFLRRAAEYGPAPMVYDYSESEIRVTNFSEALSRIDAVTVHLQSIGLRKGQRVGILSENRAEWLFAYFASVSLGLVVVPLETPWPLDEKNEILRKWTKLLGHAEAVLLFLSNRYERAIKAVRGEIPTLQHVVSFDEEAWQRITRQGKGEGLIDRPRVTSSDPASLVYTSGTTGEPKGVLVSHGNLWCSHSGALQYSKKGSVGAILLPLHHLYGFHCGMAWTISGSSVILYSTLNPTIIFESLKKMRPHGIASVPAFYEKLAVKIRQAILPRKSRRFQKLFERVVEWGGGKNSPILQKLKKTVFLSLHRRLGGRVEWMMSGGAPMDPRVRRILDFVGFRVWEGYGLTETAPVISSGDWRGVRPGSVGLPYPWAEVKIETPDETGCGEICVRGPGIMLGYFKNPEATAEMFDSEGWFHTGDLGYLDKEGFLFVTGRKKDLIVTTGGKKIVPTDVEKFFMELPFVKEVCVFCIDRPRSEGGGANEVLHLQIVPDLELGRSHGFKDYEELIKNVKKTVYDRAEQLPDYQRPKSIDFSPEAFPRSATLKVRRFLVREMFLAREKSRKTGAQERPRRDEVFNNPTGKKVENILKKLISPELDLHSGSFIAFDLGMDSLTLMEFWGSICKAFRVQIPEEDIGRLKTVGEVIQYLESLPAVRQRSQETYLGLNGESEPSGGWDVVLGELRPEEAEKVQKVLSSFPRLRPVFLRVFRWFFKWVSRLDACGLENLPSNGPYILAPNHQCHLDNLFVASFLPPEIQADMMVMGKMEHWNHWFTRGMARLCHAFPVNRKQVSGETLQVCAEVLRKGRVLLIHPEGTRTADGKLLPFKNGVAVLAQNLKCPVVPVFIQGAYEFWPKDSLLPRRRSRLKVSFGSPLFYREGSPSHFTENLTNAIKALGDALNDKALEKTPLNTETSNGTF